MQAERKIPLQLLRIREKETPITFFAPDRLIVDSGLPICFEQRELIRPALMGETPQY